MNHKLYSEYLASGMVIKTIQQLELGWICKETENMIWTMIIIQPVYLSISCM